MSEIEWQGSVDETLVYWPPILEFSYSCRVDFNSLPELSVRRSRNTEVISYYLNDNLEIVPLT